MQGASALAGYRTNDFLAIIDISRLLRLQTGVAGGIGRLNQRLVAAYQLPEITPSKREKRQASEQVKEFVEGVILSLSTESIIRWNPPGGGVDGVASRLKAKVRQGFELSDQAKRYACCNSIQMQQLDY